MKQGNHFNSEGSSSTPKKYAWQGRLGELLVEHSDWKLELELAFPGLRLRIPTEQFLIHWFSLICLHRTDPPFCHGFVEKVCPSRLMNQN